MFLWGIIASIAPLSQSWPFAADITGYLSALLVIVGPISAVVGNVSMGFLSDYIGRKRVFLITMALYFVGIIVISFSFSLFSLMAGIALSEFGIAGEEIPTISLLAEDTETGRRGSVITNGMNFSNIGSAFIAGVFILISIGNFDLFVQRLAIFSSAIVLMGIIVYSRLRLPESYRWLNVNGKKEEALAEASKLNLDMQPNGFTPQKRVSPVVSYSVLAFMGLSQYLTFGLMAYIVPYYEFSGVTVSYLIFFGLLGSSLAGPIAGRLISRGRKTYSMFAFLGGFISVLVILSVVNYLQNLLIFIPLLFINMAFSEFAWASRTTLEPELFTTRHRGRAIGYVRMVPMIAYPASIYLFANFTLYQQILSNVILWGLGVVGAIIWLLAGVETNNVDLDYQLREA